MTIDRDFIYILVFLVCIYILMCISLVGVGYMSHLDTVKAMEKGYIQQVIDGKKVWVLQHNKENKQK